MMWNMVAKFPKVVNPDCPILITRTVVPVARDRATSPLAISNSGDEFVKVSMKNTEEIVTRRVNMHVFIQVLYWHI